jgi:hypothetical protein
MSVNVKNDHDLEEEGREARDWPEEGREVRDWPEEGELVLERIYVGDLEPCMIGGHWRPAPGDQQLAHFFSQFREVS